jgi:3-ketosteroid 9alpha-monooxygenase subunit B
MNHDCAPGDNRGMSEVEHLDAAADVVVKVDLDGTQHHLSWPRDKALVDIMLDAGIDVPHDVLEPEDVAAGLILGCQARPLSDDVHIEF